MKYNLETIEKIEKKIAELELIKNQLLYEQADEKKSRIEEIFIRCNELNCLSEELNNLMQSYLIDYPEDKIDIFVQIGDFNNEN